VTFSAHASTFAGRPVVDVPQDAPLPAVDAPVAWRFSYWEWQGRSDFGPSAEFRDAFAAFVDRAGGSVEALVLGPWGYAAVDDAPIAQLCEVADRLPHLTALFLGDLTVDECEASWIRVGDLTALFAAYPRLEVLRVRAGEELRLGPVRHPALRQLAIEGGGLGREVTAAVLASDLPALTDLELWLGVGQYGGTTAVDDLAPLLSGDRFPALRRLGLRNSEIVDELAAALATAPVVGRLEVLDLSEGTLTDAGADALLGGQPLTRLRRLDLHHHYLSDAMVERVRAALPGVEVDLSGRQRQGRYGRYTAVSE
jgi:hypothetical protein